MKHRLILRTVCLCVLSLAFMPGCAELLAIQYLLPSATPFETVRAALDAYVDSDKAPLTTATVLYDTMHNGDAADDPFILDVREKDPYVKGHIPTSINIFWRYAARTTATDLLPDDKQIVVYCHTGHTGALVTTFLNAMGYDAVNLKDGMPSWTQDPDMLAAAPFDDATDSHDYETETTENTAEATNDLPTLTLPFSIFPQDIIRAAGSAYLTSEKSPLISAEALHDLLNDGDATNDPFIVSVRGADDYALGHIPGAINIPWRQIAKIENLRKLPTDRQIVIYCYSGHTGGIATMVLNMLGYDAVNLKWGIFSWTRDATIRAAQPFTADGDHSTEDGDCGCDV